MSHLAIRRAEVKKRNTGALLVFKHSTTFYFTLQESADNGTLLLHILFRSRQILCAMFLNLPGVALLLFVVFLYNTMTIKASCSILLVG